VRLEIPAAKDLAAWGRKVCALTQRGEVWCWGEDQPVPSAVVGVDRVVAMAVADSELCAERSDGGLTCWSADRRPRQVLPPGSLDGPFVGGGDGCTIRKDGLVACWGRNDYGRLGDGSVVTLASPAAVPGLH
jgi:hypothetical protein